MHRLQELVRLRRMGVGLRRIAMELKMGRNTARLYCSALETAGLLAGEAGELPDLELLKEAVATYLPPRPAPQQTSSMDRWREEVEKLLDAGVGPQAIFDRLRLEQPDFSGSLGSLKRLVARIRNERGIEPEDVAIPVDTAPGEVAQVDFGYAGKLWDRQTGRVRKAWVFVMVLGYSRHQYAEIVFDQKVTTWIALHERAFAAFGGVPQVIVPDNLKAAVIRAAFGVSGTVALNRTYRELARHYGFRVDPTPPRAPKKKGKVEANVKYVKRNCLAGRESEDVTLLNRELGRWVTEIAGQRIHGTTGRRPLEVFNAEERQTLLPLPRRPYERVVWKDATVHADSHVEYDRRLYSVPWRLLRQKVWVRATSHTVAIYWNDERVATHSRSDSGPRSTNEAHLPEGRRDLRHRSRSYWEGRADRIGEEVGSFVREVFDSDDVLSQLRMVQAIVTHLEKHPPERACAACRRASFYGTMSYQGVKNILLKALDREPLPTAKPTTLWADQPRFARSISELTGGSHERH